MSVGTGRSLLLTWRLIVERLGPATTRFVHQQPLNLGISPDAELLSRQRLNGVVGPRCGHEQAWQPREPFGVDIGRERRELVVPVERGHARAVTIGLGSVAHRQLSGGLDVLWHRSKIRIVDDSVPCDLRPRQP